MEMELRPLLAPNVKIEDRGEVKVVWVDGEPLIVNKTAGDILLLCDGTRTIQDIAKDLSRKYHGDKNKIFSDILFFIDDMRKRKILKVIK